jgi:hypothetical protein
MVRSEGARDPEQFLDEERREGERRQGDAGSTALPSRTSGAAGNRDAATPAAEAAKAAPEAR